MTLRVRLLVGVAGETRPVGEEYDLPTDEARGLLAAGRAELVRKAELETPEQASIERTVKARSKRGRTDASPTVLAAEHGRTD